MGLICRCRKYRHLHLNFNPTFICQATHSSFLQNQKILQISTSLISQAGSMNWFPEYLFIALTHIRWLQLLMEAWSSWLRITMTPIISWLVPQITYMSISLTTSNTNFMVWTSMPIQPSWPPTILIVSSYTILMLQPKPEQFIKL